MRKALLVIMIVLFVLIAGLVTTLLVTGDNKEVEEVEVINKEDQKYITALETKEVTLLLDNSAQGQLETQQGVYNFDIINRLDRELNIEVEYLAINGQKIEKYEYYGQAYSGSDNEGEGYGYLILTIKDENKNIRVKKNLIFQISMFTPNNEFQTKYNVTVEFKQ